VVLGYEIDFSVSVLTIQNEYSRQIFREKPGDSAQLSGCLPHKITLFRNLNQGSVTKSSEKA